MKLTSAFCADLSAKGADDVGTFVQSFGGCVVCSIKRDDKTGSRVFWCLVC